MLDGHLCRRGGVLWGWDRLLLLLLLLGLFDAVRRIVLTVRMAESSHRANKACTR